MTPVIPSSTSNIFLIPGSPFSARKDKSFTRCFMLKKPTKRMSYAQDFILPLSASMRLFPHIRTYNLHCKPRFGKLSATGTDVAVEQPDTPVEEKDAGEASEIPSAESSNEESSIKSKRSRPSRKSEMPPVKDEDLIPGATFTGKVRSIQPFGAFVDFGAFTDGLVHVSRLSDSYVKDVGTVVSVGQEVKVRLVEANTETGRISLTMRESDDSSKLKDSPADGEKTRPPRRNTQKSNQRRDEVKKTTKFVKGQDLEGTVKNLTRSGAFISLPEGEEGFLPTSEEADEGFGNMMGETSLEASQEVKVRVLRITRGQVTLTMKKEEDAGALNSKLQGVVHTATNPFLLAFRKNKDIAAFLDAKEKEEDTISVVDGKGEQDEVSQAEVDEEPEIVVSDSLKSVGTSVESIEEEIQGVVEEPETVVSDSLETVDNAVQSIEEETPEVVESEITISDSLGSVGTAVQSIEEVLDEPESVVSDSVESADTEAGSFEEETREVIEDPEIVVSSSVESVDAAAESIKEEAQEVIKDPETAVSDSVESMDTAAESIGEETQEVVEEPENVVSSSVESEDTGAQSLEEEIQEVVEDPKQVSDSLENLDSKEQNIEAETQEVVEVKSEGEPDEIILNKVETPTPSSEVEISSPSVEEENLEAQMQTPGNENEISSSTAVIDNSVEPDFDEGSNITSGEQVKISVEENDVSSLAPVEDEPSPDGNIGITSSTKETNVSFSKESSTDETQVGEIVEPQNVEVTTQKNGSIANLNGQNGAPSAVNTTKATISPALVKQLREETGAGMMDCKKALSETGGDLVKAQEFLRKKGLSSADKKASRVTAEGRIGSYVHDSRIGVLIEVNSETDFVSRGDIFKELVNDLAMQVAACPQVEYLVTEDVPEEIVEKEKEIEMQKEDLASKPEQIRSKIVEGRIRKRLEELALLEQPYIKNDKVVVRDLVKQTIATIGENIKVKRFVRFNLGEGLEKKSQDFAAEVAAQTSAKPVAAPEKEQPATVETKETDEKPAAKATISAALVKQLREETGAGMMDCKKALSETGGDLQMAQEYLRKKGLSTADKKSSRLAAEGRIGSYIHDSRIGVLIEINCETDFVGRSEKFKELVDDLAMQVVACPAVEYVSVEDIPESIVNKEKELEMQREDILSKPENIRERIVDGRVSKRLGELALLEQPFLKDDSILVKDLVKQTVAAIGENIKVRRFVRFTLGEETDAKTESEA